MKFLKNAYKGLKENNVEEVQWWLGDLFTLLCEHKEAVDPNIMEEILALKTDLMDSISRFLFIYTKFKNNKQLEEKMKNVINLVDTRLADVKLYLQNTP